jgi:hypothetical protein
MGELCLQHMRHSDDGVFSLTAEEKRKAKGKGN